MKRPRGGPSLQVDRLDLRQMLAAEALGSGRRR
jgi:hypothetical protein